MTQSPRQIGIAVVEHDGKYLIGERPPGQVLAGCAEFPGGKCEPGESPRDCAVRECGEETGVAVFAERLLANVPYRYPHGEVDLHFWLCHPAEVASVDSDHQGYRWVSRDRLAKLQFPAANQPVIELLRSRSTIDESNPGFERA